MSRRTDSDIWVVRENADRDEDLVVVSESGSRVHIRRRKGSKRGTAANREEPQVSRDREINKENLKKAKFNKPGWITFGASALMGLSLIQPGTFLGVALVFGLAWVAGKAISIMSTPMDTTPHNKPNNESVHYTVRTAPIQEIPRSGDANADSLIERGEDMLRQIRSANAAIPDSVLTAQMNELEDRCVQILTTVSEKPDQAGQVRKFMNYYLPTTLKMLTNYRVMSERGVSSVTLSEARNTLIRGMDMVLTACRKQLDNLYRGDMLDISTDIDVLEQMLKRDGFSELSSDTAPIMEQQTSQTGSAAMQQMRATGAPVLEVPEEDSTDDYAGYYTAKKRQQNR